MAFNPTPAWSKYLNSNSPQAARRNQLIFYAVGLWSAKLSGPSPHLRGCEALQLHVDLVYIKGLWIKRAPDPFQHLLVLGVRWIVDCFHETRVAPDATAILRGTGSF